MSDKEGYRVCMQMAVASLNRDWFRAFYARLAHAYAGTFEEKVDAIVLMSADPDSDDPILADVVARFSLGCEA